jgi:hypothetical protein
LDLDNNDDIKSKVNDGDGKTEVSFFDESTIKGISPDMSISEK